MDSIARIVLLYLCTVVSVLSALRTVPQVLDEAWNVNSKILHQVASDVSRSDGEDFATTNITWVIAWTGLYCYCGSENWLAKFAYRNKDSVIACVPKTTSNSWTWYDLYSGYYYAYEVNTCSYDCIFRRENLVNSNGEMNMMTTKNYFMENVFNDEWIGGIAENVMDKCLDMYSNYAMKNAKNMYACNTASYYFILCLMDEMTGGCPDDQLSEDYGCQAYYYILSISRLFN